MGNNLVSIVMATYNGEKYLKYQLDSIIAQTYPHFELIVVDDASTDGTLEILNEYALRDNRITIFSAKKNLGLVANFERGLELARGKYIALSDQDDVFQPDKIEILLCALKDHPTCDLVVSDLTLIDESGNVIADSMWNYQKLKPRAGKPFHKLVYRNFATGCAIMFRSRLLEIALPFPRDCKVHDWWLTVVATSSRAGGVCLIDNKLTLYRQHSLNMIGAKKIDALKIIRFIHFLTEQPDQIILEKRNGLFRQEIERLTSYLQSSIWTSRERRIIECDIKLFEIYVEWLQQNLIKRLFILPQRIFYTVMSGRLRA